MNEIEIPEIFSDVWYEKNINLLDRQIESRKLFINFSEVKWVELSALISLTMCIIKNKNKIDEIELIFKIDPKDTNKMRVNAFVFLVESNFCLAIAEASEKNLNKLKLKFTIIDSNNESINKIFVDIKDYLSSTYLNNEITKAVKIDKGKNDIFAISIDLKKFKKFPIIDSSFISIFGLKGESLKDQIILPLTFINKKIFSDYTTFCSSSFFESKITVPFDNALLKLPENRKNFIYDIKNHWLQELLSNSFEHGGNNIIIGIRYGDWNIRFNKDIGSKDSIISNGYDYKIRYHEENEKKRYHKFIDIYISDDGAGFETIKKVFILDKYKNKFIPEDFNPSLLVLHRYALYPYSSRKLEAQTEIKPSTITGLGLLAEHTVMFDGLIAIKDRDKLTWFDKETLTHISNQGRVDYSSIADLGFTKVAIIMPLTDEEWTEEYDLKAVDVNDGEVDKFLYSRLSNEADISGNDFYLFENKINEKYFFQKISYSSIVDRIDKNVLVVLDISEKSSLLRKNAAMKLVNDILKFRDAGYPVCIYGADISDMKLFQSVIAGDLKLLEFDLTSWVKNNELLCPILSCDFKIFLCGNLAKEHRKELLKYFTNDSKLTELTKEKLFSWGLTKILPFPFRKIERSINKIHGKFLLADLENKYVTRANIRDVHGSTLNIFYEILSYFSYPENIEKWFRDIIRYISKYNANLIIVDSVEVKNLVLRAIDENKINSIKVLRLFNYNIEGKDQIKKDSRILLVISCAFSGSILKAAKRYIEYEKIPIIGVVSLIDLTGKGKRTIQEEITGCAYDYLAKGEKPKKNYDKSARIDYIATRNARLLPAKVFLREREDLFKSYIHEKFVSKIFDQTSNIYVGHKIEHGHHYDVFFDVRKSIETNDIFAQYFRLFLYEFITEKKSIIIYPEESELTCLINRIKLSPGNKKVSWIAARNAYYDTYYWSDHNNIPNLKDKEVIIVDEGVYSGASLIGILKLVLENDNENRPKGIDIVVLEKRFSVRNYGKALQRMKQYYERQNIKIDFNSIIDIKAPCWGNDDCPYCSANYPAEARSPKKFNSYLIDNIFEIKDEIGLILWFNEGIYSDSKTADDRLWSIKAFFEKNINCSFLCAEMIIIHSEIFEKWNILSNALKILEYSLRFIRLENDIINLINLSSGISNLILRKKIFEIIIIRFILKISNSRIFWAFADAIKKNLKLKNEFNELIEGLNLSANILQKWQLVFEYIEDGNIAEVIKEIFIITQFNRRDSHNPLGNQILMCGDSIDNKTKQKLSDLKNSLLRIKNFDTCEQLLKVIDDPCKIGILLKDKSFKERFKKEFTFTSDGIISNIKEAINENATPQEYKNLYRQREDKSYQIPLMCINQDLCNKLMMHIQNNRIWGRCKSQFIIENDIFKIFLESDKIRSIDKVKEDRESVSFKQLQKDLQLFGAKIDYDLKNGKFCVNIELRVIDYDEI